MNCCKCVALRFPWLFLLVVSSFGLLHPEVARSQTFAPYSDFQSMNLTQLATLQVKLTYVGAQNHVLKTLTLTSPTNALDLSKFIPFQRPGISYFNDTVEVETCTASLPELKAVIDNVGTLPNITAGGVAANAVLSFSLFNSQPSDAAFEAILDNGQADDLFAQLRVSLADNKNCLRKVSEMACPLGLLEAARPTDVTADVSVVLSGVRLQRKTGGFVGTATVTNNSGTSLQPPISLVVDLEGGNVKLANADGMTCGISPMGRQFINLPSGLAPGESTELTLEFDNPDKEQITAATKVLAGPGAR